jgi:hypothetical protein
MWEPSAPLALSTPERAILEALTVSKDIPGRVRKRGKIVLMAAGGVANAEIARSCSIARPRVLEWRRRFEKEGIRGLWDREEVAPHLAEKVQKGIVNDGLNPPLSQWLKVTSSVRRLARRYHVSSSTVHRIWDKHGIHMERRPPLCDRAIKVEKLKISQDPLFGVTVYAIGGLFYENHGPVLVFCSRNEPFSGLELSELATTKRGELVDVLVTKLKALSKRWFGLSKPAENKFIDFLKCIQEKPAHDGAELHVVTVRPKQGVAGTAEAQAWIAQQERIHMHYMPSSAYGREWADFAERWLRIISAWPLQTSFLATVEQISRILDELPKEKHLNTLVIS